MSYLYSTFDFIQGERGFLQRHFQTITIVYSTEYTEWQWPLSAAHSIMMKNQPSLVKVVGARLPPFTISTITFKVVMYAPAERADKLPLFLLCPHMYSVDYSQRHSESELLNYEGAQESIPRNQLRQPMQPGGPVRQHYSYSVPSSHRLCLFCVVKHCIYKPSHPATH